VMNRTGRTRAESVAALKAERGVVRQAIQQLLESGKHLS
jgi:NACalpha-BTF3-like transcription factor